MKNGSVFQINKTVVGIVFAALILTIPHRSNSEVVTNKYNGIDFGDGKQKLLPKFHDGITYPIGTDLSNCPGSGPNKKIVLRIKNLLNQLNSDVGVQRDVSDLDINANDDNAGLPVGEPTVTPSDRATVFDIRMPAGSTSKTTYSIIRIKLKRNANRNVYFSYPVGLPNDSSKAISVEKSGKNTMFCGIGPIEHKGGHDFIDVGVFHNTASQLEGFNINLIVYSSTPTANDPGVNYSVPITIDPKVRNDG